MERERVRKRRECTVGESEVFLGLCELCVVSKYTFIKYVMLWLM